MACGLEFWAVTKRRECHEDHRVDFDCPIGSGARRATRERLQFQNFLGSAGPIALLSGSNAEAKFARQPHAWGPVRAGSQAPLKRSRSKSAIFHVYEGHPRYRP
jgi:hypothetical protein